MPARAVHAVRRRYIVTQVQHNIAVYTQPGPGIRAKLHLVLPTLRIYFTFPTYQVGSISARGDRYEVGVPLQQGVEAGCVLSHATSKYARPYERVDPVIHIRTLQRDEQPAVRWARPQAPFL